MDISCWLLNWVSFTLFVAFKVIGKPECLLFIFRKSFTSVMILVVLFKKILACHETVLVFQSARQAMLLKWSWNPARGSAPVVWWQTPTGSGEGLARLYPGCTWRLSTPVVRCFTITFSSLKKKKKKKKKNYLSYFNCWKSYGCWRVLSAKKVSSFFQNKCFPLATIILFLKYTLCQLTVKYPFFQENVSL